jgi:hypothetical protein
LAACPFGVEVVDHCVSESGSGSWTGFAAWAVVGLLLVGGAFLFPLLVITWPLGAAAVWRLVRRAVRAAELVGFVNGVGVLCLLIAFTQRNSNPCGTSVTAVIGPGGGEAGCGGADPQPFLIFGLLLAVASATAYLGLRKRRGVQW